jgi:lipopolysaccharide biosynthesis glycosyltransferase
MATQMRNSFIHVATACDDNYAPRTAVFIQSLQAANPGTGFHIHVLTPDAFSGNRVLQRSAGGATKLAILPVDMARLGALKVCHHFKPATYLRLLMGQLLPANVTRVLYMDSDILVTGPLSELWETSLGGAAIAAVIDCVVDDDHRVRERIGLTQGEHYFNAGVMLVDLRLWRDADWGGRALAFVRAEPDRITYVDQCALNFVAAGRFKALPRKWNYQSSHVVRTADGSLAPECEHDLSTAHVIHFTGKIKPWDEESMHPMAERYRQFAAGGS